MRKWIAAALLSASAGAAFAAEPQVSMTIYNSNLALVEEVRTLDIPAGRQRLEFKDVSAAIRPETVALTAPGVTIVEQNFDYDLLTPDKLMEKAVGRQVQIVRTNPGTGAQTTETATVLAVNNGVVLKIGDRIEVLRDDGVPTRVIFDKVPENLRARPTLSVMVDSDTAGPRQARLSYLSTGLSWKADYVALFDEKANALDLQGWITLKNQSGTDFRDAETRLVAGNVHLIRSEGDYGDRRRYPALVTGTNTGTGPQALGDYYLYPLPGRTTIAQNQTKQIGFMEASGVAATKRYQYRAQNFSTEEYPQSAKVVVRLADQALPALPKGVMRVYIRDATGEPKFVGESQIEHAAAGAEIPVPIGEAFDVTVQPSLEKNERVSKTRARYVMNYLIRNARSAPVTVEVVQGGLWRNGKVLDETLKSRRIDASTLSWDVPVPANGETTLTFTVENSW